jgi:signal transduction histidine kinase
MSIDVRSALMRYGFAGAAVALAFGLTAVLGPVRDYTPSLLLVVAVLASGWYGSLRPALFAGVLAVLALDWFLPPAVNVFPGFAALLRLAILAAGVALILALKARSDRHERERRRLIEQLRAEREQLAEAGRHKDEFLALLGHELRNPLAPVRNALRVMRLQHPDPAAEPLRALMERQIAKLTLVVDGLLDMARVAQGKIRLRKERVDLAALVRAAAEAARPPAEENRHRLAVDVPPGPLVVEADPTRLEQVLGNLLDNAIQFTPPGGRIDVAAEPDGAGAVVRVRDSGIGIPAALLPHVFDLFTQAGRVPGRPAEGLGVGLTLVRRLVELHGGTVEAQSAGPGQGSEFVVRLPSASAVAPPHAWPFLLPQARDGG